MAFYQLHREQLIQASLEEVWEFIGAPQNLKRITPPYMGFDITTGHLPPQMYEGMIISYTVSPLLGIKMDWVTEITHVREHAFFVDEQRIGPYRLWHHQHHIKDTGQGVLMTDIVTYAPPFGILGELAHALYIKKRLNEIFDYRYVAVEKLFGKEKLQEVSQ